MRSTLLADTLARVSYEHVIASAGGLEHHRAHAGVMVVIGARPVVVQEEVVLEGRRGAEVQEHWSICTIPGCVWECARVCVCVCLRLCVCVSLCAG